MIPAIRSLPYEETLPRTGLWALYDRQISADVIDVYQITRELSTVRFITFLPRIAMPARYVPLSCFCLSVCLSQVGVLLKRLNVGSRKQRHTIAQGL